MSNFSIFFPALSTLGLGTAEKWHIATKTSNTYDAYLSVEIVFTYYDVPAQFDITNKRSK